MSEVTKKVEDKNEAAQEELKNLIEKINQADKIFLRARLDMSWSEIAEGDFLLAIALWKKKGGGNIEWQFVMNMTDNEIAEELGLDLAALAEAAGNE